MMHKNQFKSSFSKWFGWRHVHHFFTFRSLKHQAHNESMFTTRFITICLCKRYHHFQQKMCSFSTPLPPGWKIIYHKEQKLFSLGILRTQAIEIHDTFLKKEQQWNTPHIVFIWKTHKNLMLRLIELF